MNVSRDGLDVFDRCYRQDAVSEVEDVPRTAAGSFEHVVDRFENAIERCEQHGGIEIALDGAIGADAIPGLVERRAPVDADDVASRVAKLAKDRAGSDAEVDGRHAERRDPLEDALRVRQDELAIVVGVELTDPRIEHLYDVDTGFDLCSKIVADELGQLVAERMPRFWRAIHQRLRVREV